MKLKCIKHCSIFLEKGELYTGKDEFPNSNLYYICIKESKEEEVWTIAKKEWFEKIED